MDLNALTDFNLVATHGGLGKASRASKRSKATLSRRIAMLEEQLGIRLIERSSTGLELTESGQLLFSRIEGPINEVLDAMTAASEGLARPRGQLRIAAPMLFSQLALGQLCARFRALYPEVTLEVVAEDRVANLVDERFDVAIRPNPRPDSALVGRCFARDRSLVVAAPSLSKPAAGPHAVRVPAVVMATRPGTTWELDGGRLTLEPVPVMRLSSLLMLRDAALAGAGIALLPASIVWQQISRGELVEWGTIERKEVELWVLHTSRRLASPKVSAFVEFMCQQYPDGHLMLPG
ncbi:MAG: LysR family transcriptional regulator [Burkholderiales bacterium RIFCSPLOWO2_12_FULL_61_40]|nr:MAG: LysR family transcriptional regulator [Burkholderiales bacterium RIFCSPLOWO2_12_FULL_61_40]